jgi:hypothetical protein
MGTPSPNPWDLTLSGQNVPFGFLRTSTAEATLAEPPNCPGPLAGTVVPAIVLSSAVGPVEINPAKPNAVPGSA